MEQKQTAVEWLDRWFRDNPEATHEEGNKALHHAKEMEKQQHKNTWFDSTAQFDNAAEMTYKKTFEQYYNGEYGK